MRKIKVICCLLWMANQLLAQVDVNLIITPNQISLGEKVNYNVELSMPLHFKLIKVPQEADFKEDQLSYFKLDTEKKELNTNQRYIMLNYQLFAYDVGEMAIATKSIVIKNSKDNQHQKIIIPKVWIPIASNFDPSEQKSIVFKQNLYLEKLNKTKYILYAIGVVLLLLIALWVYFYFKKQVKGDSVIKKLKNSDERSPLEFLNEEVVCLYDRQLYEKNNLKTHYVKMSEIIKIYLGKILNQNILELTTNEVLQECIDLLDQNQLLKLKNILELSDQIKFARYMIEHHIHIQQKNKVLDLASQIWEKQEPKPL